MFKKIVLSLVMALFATSAIAAEKTYVVASDPTWPPMQYVSADKEIIGYEIDYVKAIADAMGFEVEIKNVAWDGLFAGLDAGRFDMVASSVTITEDRLKVMDFSKPFYKVKQAVILPKDSTATSIADLKGKTLGAQLGTTGYFAIQKMDDVTAKSYDEVSYAMESAFTGRIDGVVCDEPTAASFALMREEYAEKLKIAFIIEDADEEEYGIVVKKGNTELLDLLNAGIDKVRESGVEAELQKKWFGSVQE